VPFVAHSAGVVTGKLYWSASLRPLSHLSPVIVSIGVVSHGCSGCLLRGHWPRSQEIRNDQMRISEFW
jgi:hypothetical protein